MILVADSGSTKTDWRLVDGTFVVKSFRTVGINPFFHTSETIAEELSDMHEHLDISLVHEVYFYGAGCSTAENKEMVGSGLQTVLPDAKINVYHDLLGAARALFQNEDGIAGILGTGSNACLYRDGKVELVLGGQGYIIGDEGSGMHIGRKLIRDYMNYLTPQDVKVHFEAEFGLSRHEISQALYRKRFPNRFLASFSKYVGENIANPYMYDLVDDAMMKYVDRYISQFPDYKNLPFRVIGSVGYHFQDILAKHAERVGTRLDRVLKAPIDGLVAFHSNPQ